VSAAEILPLLEPQALVEAAVVLKTLRHYLAALAAGRHETTLEPAGLLAKETRVAVEVVMLGATGLRGALAAVAAVLLRSEEMLVALPGVTAVLALVTLCVQAQLSTTAAAAVVAQAAPAALAVLAAAAVLRRGLLRVLERQTQAAAEQVVLLLAAPLVAMAAPASSWCDTHWFALA
jgi:hypothetical protein